MFSNFPTHYEKQLAIEIYLKETLIIETASVSKQNLNVEKKSNMSYVQSDMKICIHMLSLLLYITWEGWEIHMYTCMLNKAYWGTQKEHCEYI